MNKIITTIKNLFLNKNAVTILGVLAGVIALWFVYSMTLNKAISPQRVPVAVKDLIAGQVITKDDFEYVEINSEFLKTANVITNSTKLIGYYVTNNTSIAKGAMFYTSQVVDKSELVERDLEIIEKDHKMYWLKVDNTSTYANSIYPGDKIDLWLKAKNEYTGNVFVYEEFITSITVLAVKDSSAQNVFSVSSGRTPAWLAFSVDEEMYNTLKKIEYLSTKGMQLFPVPKNKLYTIEGAETSYVNDQLRLMIDSFTV